MKYKNHGFNYFILFLIRKYANSEINFFPSDSFSLFRKFGNLLVFVM